MTFNIFNRFILTLNIKIDFDVKKHWKPKVIKLAKEGKKLEGAKIMIEDAGFTLNETVKWYAKNGFSKQNIKKS